MCQFLIEASASIKCSLKSYDRGEDLVKVNSFDLREAFCYEVGALVAIGFDVKNPAIVYDFPAFQYIDKFKYISLSKHIELSGTCFSPFLLLIRW